MKKIMFFRSLISLGGTEIAILNLIKRLDKNAYDIYIGYDDETSSKDLLNRYREYAKVVNVKDGIDIEFDAFIVCTTRYHLLPSVALIKRKKTILWVHYLMKQETSALRIPEEANKLDYIISVSKTLTKRLENMYPYLKGKIKTIYNVLNDIEIKTQSNEPIKLELSNTLNLVTVARVCKAKGYERMLYLAKYLKDANIDFKWFIAGGNYHKEEMEEILKKYELYKDNFVWFGFIDNPHNIVKQCDYTVLLSDEETWGLVLTEAMLLGVPCISTDFEVAFEQITDKENGIILSRENPESYKERITDIITNKDKYKKSVANFKYKNDDILKEWNEVL